MPVLLVWLNMWFVVLYWGNAWRYLYGSGWELCWLLGSEVLAKLCDDAVC